MGRMGFFVWHEICLRCFFWRGGGRESKRDLRGKSEKDREEKLSERVWKRRRGERQGGGRARVYACVGGMNIEILRDGAGGGREKHSIRDFV